MTIEYTNPSSRDIKEKEDVAPRVSSKRKQVKTTEEPVHYGSYHSGPKIVYQPFANLKLQEGKMGYYDDRMEGMLFNATVVVICIVGAFVCWLLMII